MQKILEPIFLNEEMLLNTAAHVFDGYALSEEHQTNKAGEAKVEASVGVTLLSKLFSPVSVKGEGSKRTDKSIKSERLFTLGGLHMSLVKELSRGKNNLQTLNVTAKEDDLRKTSFLRSTAILKPVDFYEIIQLLTLLRPLLVKLFDEFGDQMFENRGSLTVLNEVELPKYDKMIKTLLESLEEDYLRSRQLEMIMISPRTGKPFGILDIPLGDDDPLEMKSKFNDGQFFVVGKLIRYVDKESKLSLVQRSSFSQIVILFEKLVGLSGEKEALKEFREGAQSVEKLVNNIIKLSLPGPAVRMLALSVSA